MDYKIIDADGHVIEDDSLFDYLDLSYRAQDHQLSWDRLFPSLDFHHIGGHSTRNKKSFGGGKRVGPKEWLEFVEMADLEYAVLYPTKGLRIGNISHPDWACFVARAYNDWLHDRYLKASVRLKGMALLPLQDVDEAVVELRRAITKLGFVGAMLPSRGLPFDLGHKTYWPVYAEAERLGCALGVHGGAHHSMGLDTFETFVPIHALGHPLSLIIAFTGMVYHGVFNQFPRLRMGFLEGGAGWVTFWMDRLDRSHSYHLELNLRGKYQGPSTDDVPSDYIKKGQVYIGCEGNEEGLPYQIQRAGNQHFLFASDFPHEIGPDDILHEIEEVAEAPLSDADKRAVLRENAKRFYQI
jgi:predicted TIM-barrel fold metal-dependent hydrolase